MEGQTSVQILLHLLFSYFCFSCTLSPRERGTSSPTESNSPKHKALGKQHCESNLASILVSLTQVTRNTRPKNRKALWSQLLQHALGNASLIIIYFNISLNAN